MQKGIIFTDVDGTLVFHQKFHAIRELARTADRRVLVEDPLTGQQLFALDVSILPVVAYLAESTRQLALQLKQEYHIFLTTGATEEGMRKRLQHMDFADGYILEHGGRILDVDFNEDPYWAAVFQPYLETLQQIKTGLEGMGWQIVDAGRKTFLQVKAFENSQRTEEDFQTLCQTLELPEGFVKTFNLGNLTVIPQSSGKGRAVAHYLRQHPELAPHSIGIGDDLNDLDFLLECNQVYVPSSAVPEVIRAAHQHGWYLADKPHFQGIDQILTEILTSRAG